MYTSKYTGEQVDERLDKVDNMITTEPADGKIKQLKEGDKIVYPLTSTKAIVDEQGNRVTLATTADIEQAIRESIINELNSEV